MNAEALREAFNADVGNSDPVLHKLHQPPVADGIEELNASYRDGGLIYAPPAR